MVILRALLLSIIFLYFPSSFKRWTHSFRPSKCLLSWPYNPDWEIPSPDPSIQAILKQPFTYFKKGAQSYVFLSEDQKYVFKLFRFDQCRMPLGKKFVREARKWMRLREKHDLPLEIKVPKTLSSCKIAYDFAPHLTGIVYAHLIPHSMDLPFISIKDRLGRSYEIDPARYCFVVQKKAEPFLLTLLNSKDPLPLLDSYLSLISEFSRLGLANLDPTMGRNFGFIDKKAIGIDLGNFVIDPQRAKGDRSHFSKRLLKWLQKRRPELVSYVEEKIACL